MQSYLERVQLLRNELPPLLFKKPIEYVFTIGQYSLKQNPTSEMLRAGVKTQDLDERDEEQDEKDSSIHTQRSIELFDASVQKDNESSEQLQQKKQQLNRYDQEDKGVRQITRRREPKKSKYLQNLIIQRQAEQHLRDSQAAFLQSEEIQQQQMFQNSSSSSDSHSSQPIDDLYPQNYDFDEDTNFLKYYEQGCIFAGNHLTKEQQRQEELQQTRLYQKKWIDTLREIPLEILANSSNAFHIMNRNYLIRLEMQGGKKGKNGQGEDEYEGSLNDNSKSSKETVAQSTKRVMFREDIRVIRFRESDEVDIINHTDQLHEKLNDYEKEIDTKGKQGFQSIFCDTIEPMINSDGATTMLSSWIRSVYRNYKQHTSISSDPSQQHKPHIILDLDKPQIDLNCNNSAQILTIRQSESKTNSYKFSNNTENHDVADLVTVQQVQKEGAIQTIVGSAPRSAADPDDPDQRTAIQHNQPK